MPTKVLKEVSYNGYTLTVEKSGASHDYEYSNTHISILCDEERFITLGCYSKNDEWIVFHQVQANFDLSFEELRKQLTMAEDAVTYFRSIDIDNIINEAQQIYQKDLETLRIEGHGKIDNFKAWTI